MRKRLFLTSQGIPKKLKKTFLSFLSKKPQDNSVSFITTAAYGDYKNPTWLNIYKNQLRNYGIQKIEELDLKDKTQKELEKILSNKDIIFVNGGNPFYLLYWVKKSGFHKIIKRLLNKDKLYIGISAGSYICCPTIEMATWKHQDRNKIGIKDLKALNFIPFLITAHFNEKHYQIINKAAQTIHYAIVVLTDAQAVLVENDKVKVVGEGKRNFFNNFKEIQ